MTAPTVYATPRQYVGFQRESIPGQPNTTALVTVPVTNFDPDDQPTWIDDMALRGAMTGPFNRVPGPIHTEFSIGGPVYLDSIGYLLGNVFGEILYGGTPTGTGSTTLSSAAIVGATTIATVATVPATTIIQIDTGTLTEVRTVSSVTGAGPFTLTLDSPLAKPHNTAVAVVPILNNQTTQKYSVLNSGNGQPSTLTIADYQGPTVTSGVRVYPGCCLSEIDFSASADSTALTYTAQGLGWPSVAGTSFAPNPSTVLPQPAWEGKIGLNGTVAGAQIKYVNQFSLALKRELQIYNTAQNSQSPYAIVRGRLTASGSMNFVVADETYLSYLVTNAQPQLQIILDNGISGSAHLAFTLDMQQCAFTTSKLSRGNPAVEAQVTFDAIANTTNTGFSGLEGPLTITVANSVTPNLF